MPSLAVLAAFLQLTAPSLSNVDRAHDDNVQAFANTVAVARVASDRCADILVSEQMLLDARERLGLTEADGPAILIIEADMMQLLERAIVEAPSLQAWCDATYRNYGPDGQILPGLMKRLLGQKMAFRLFLGRRKSDDGSVVILIINADRDICFRACFEGTIAGP